MACLVFGTFGCGQRQRAQPGKADMIESGSPDLSSPSSCLASFFSSINDGNMTRASMCVDGGASGQFMNAMADNLRKRNAKFAVADVHATIGQGNALITYSLSVTNLGPTRNQPAVSIDSVLMKQINGKWMLVPNGEAKLTSIGATALATIFAYPTSAPQSPVGQILDGEVDTNDAIKKERDLGLAMLQFAEDHGGKFTFRPNLFQVDLIQYLPRHSPSSFESCSLGDFDGVMFSLNDRMIGKSMFTDHAFETILLYEGSNEKLAFHHDGKTVLLFVDGHTRLVTPEQASDKSRVQWGP